MPQLQCTDRDGNSQTFEYEFKPDMSKLQWTFRVWQLGEDLSNGFFELVVTEVSPSDVRITMLNHFQIPMYRAKGIPDALIPEVRRALDRNVQSSPTRGATADVYRTKDATKVWNRLVEAGLARHDKTTDVFHLL